MRLSDVYWLLDDPFHPDADALQPGSGGLPHTWLDEPGLHLAMRALGRSSGLITEYGESRGDPGLRSWIQRYLSDRGVPAHIDHIVLTNGASQALNLVVRAPRRPLYETGRTAREDCHDSVEIFSNDSPLSDEGHLARAAASSPDRPEDPQLIKPTVC